MRLNEVVSDPKFISKQTVNSLQAEILKADKVIAYIGKNIKLLFSHDQTVRFEKDVANGFNELNKASKNYVRRLNMMKDVMKSRI